MSFLLFQIFFLLLLAALLGALLAWWFLSRNQEVVTETEETLLRRLDREREEDRQARERLGSEIAGLKRSLSDIGQPDLAPVDRRLRGLEERLGRVDQLVTNFRVPDPDLRPLYERMSGVERAVTGISLPEPDMRPLMERLQGIEAYLMSNTPDLDGVQTRLGQVESGLSSVYSAVANIQPADLSAIEQRLTTIEELFTQIEIPEVELGPVHSQLALLEQAIGNLEPPATDLAPVHNHIRQLEESVAQLRTGLPGANSAALAPITSEISALSAAIGQMRAPSLDPLYERFNHLDARLANLQFPVTDLSPLREQVERVEQRIANLRIPGTDMTPLQERLDRLERYLGAPDREPDSLHSRFSWLEARLSHLRNADLQPVQARLEEIMGRMESAERDFSPITGRLDRLENRLAAPESRFDALTNRLAELESAVASVFSAVSEQPATDLRPVETRLSRIEDAVANPRQPEIDLGPVHSELDRVERTLLEMRTDVQQMPALDPLIRRLDALQEAIGRIREPDLGPVMQSVRAIDSRIDLDAVEDRLSAIEYGLAAVHHTLRSKPQSSASSRSAAREYVPRRSERASYDEEPARAVRPEPRRYVQREPAPRDPDPLGEARRHGDQSNLLEEPAFGRPDDLEQINGVGPMLGELLQEIGVFYFWQIAEWDARDIAWVDSKLMHFRGRIERDDWVRQARELMDMPGAARRPE